MATAPKKQEIGIELPQLDLRLMEVTVIGDSPLIVHAWSEKAKKEMLGKQMKQAKADQPYFALWVGNPSLLIPALQD